MNITAIKENLKAAQSIAQEVYGENAAPEIVAAILNSITAQSVGTQIEQMTADLCRAAAVAAGD